MTKIAICFFGLTRSLQHTISSIQSKIFDVLTKHHIDYDVFLHTYDLKYLTNKRSNEFHCSLDINEWKLLNPISYSITNQDIFDKQYDWKVLKKQGDFWKDGFCSTRNAIRQLNSLKEVTKLWKDKPRYDFYLYLRPDLQYVNTIQVRDILNHIHTPKIIFIPSWGNHMGGLNDRIAYGSYETMQIYGNRIDYIPYHYTRKRGSMKKPYHSERFLCFIIARHKINVKWCNLKGIRIRADYTPNPDDYKHFTSI